MQITIVIPVFNRAACLLRTLQSVPADFPLIVVDNGSTDGSAAMAEDFCRHRPRALFASEPTSGAPAARNRGLALCQTEWVYFFDSDDLFTPLPSIDAATVAKSDMLCFPVRMVVDGRERIRDYRPTADAATHVLSAMLSTQSMLFRAAWLRSIGGWDNRCRIWNDWELGLRALLRRPRLQWISADEPRHRIYVHADSITGPSYGARWESIRDTLRVAYDDALGSADHRVLRALDLRTQIVCGMLRREGVHQAAEAIRQLVQQPSLMGRLIELYVRLGGRGAWRIAIKTLKP